MVVLRERINGVLEEWIGIVVWGLLELFCKRDGVNVGDVIYFIWMFYFFNDLWFKGYV